MPRSQTVVRDIDHGWKRIKKELLLAETAICKVGVQSDAGKHDSDKKTDVVTVAAVNEFGAPNRNIPERPFIRLTADQQRRKLDEIKVEEISKIYKGTSTVAVSLNRMGLFLAKEIRKTIDEYERPENAPATQLAKGKKVGKGVMINNPLVDTGQLKQSIRHQIEGL